MSGSDDGSGPVGDDSGPVGDDSGPVGDDSGPDEDADGDDRGADDAPPEFDPADVAGGDIEPVGAMIAVAFTGAVIGLVGAGTALFVGDLGLALIGVGVVVALSSPLAYVRLRRRYGA